MVNIIPILDRKLKTLYAKHKDSNPDNGGCGFIAKILYNELVKINIKPEIVVLTSWFWYSEAQENINSVQDMVNSNSPDIKTNNDLNGMGVVLTHVALYYKGHYIDLSGCYPSLSDTTWSSCKKTITLTPEILERISSTREGWNDTFDIDRLPSIEVDIKDLCESIKEEQSLKLLSA